VRVIYAWQIGPHFNGLPDVFGAAMLVFGEVIDQDGYSDMRDLRAGLKALPERDVQNEEVHLNAAT